MMVLNEVILTVMTLNVWGIYLVSKDRVKRIDAIASALSTGKYDVVCLQEVWVADDFKKIKNEAKKVLPYSHYFYSGVTGSGLCIFSRWPMEDIMFHQWPVNGYVHKIFHGDWFGGKGVGICHISVNGVHINIYTTHLHAQYDMKDDEYLAHRVVQAFDTAQFVSLTSPGAHLSVLAGDLNTQPGNLCHQLIKHTAQLYDSFDEAQTRESMIGTNDCSRNSYADNKKVAVNPKGDRIDHILYRSGLNSKVKVLSYSLPLESRVPDCEFSYSDHEAIAATFKVIFDSLDVSDSSHYIKDKGELTSALKAGITVCNEAINNLAKTKIWYYAIAVTLFIALLSVPVVTNIPILYSGTYQLSVVIASGIIFFTFIMATLWNNVEYHGLLGGQLRMQIVLDRTTNASGVYNSDTNSDNISTISTNTRQRSSITILDEEIKREKIV
ncbi:neutral sphingomyelinase [Lycorma delicatula]|uniref:neutral sphingomyelinase n=1 Tax=Lycorma delicatula TaxID=130591 RepID=UPI003F515082